MDGRFAIAEDILKKLLEVKPNLVTSEAKETGGGQGRGGNPNPFRGEENQEVEILEGGDGMAPLEPLSREEIIIGYERRGADFARRGRVSLDSNWVSPWTNSRMDDASTSSAIRSVGLTGVQMMMRQLASVSENYAHRSSADASVWNLWPSLHASGSSPSQPSLNHNRNIAGVRFRNTTPPSDLLAMVDRVREVLPHMPDELIIQDLLRTNNINITVNNLLMM
ncbi:hypothetical protein M5K25_026333 [Dendrobium thyrsiflorum]|uniref:CUE domain-containing protein n=1 Tax=Dendrobium thyrsiflorum TaxID=117978 RepID=A0ABD0TX26_DENTH